MTQTEAVSIPLAIVCPHMIINLSFRILQGPGHGPSVRSSVRHEYGNIWLYVLLKPNLTIYRAYTNMNKWFVS